MPRLLGLQAQLASWQRIVVQHTCLHQSTRSGIDCSSHEFLKGDAMPPPLHSIAQWEQWSVQLFLSARVTQAQCGFVATE